MFENYGINLLIFDLRTMMDLVSFSNPFFTMTRNGEKRRFTNRVQLLSLQDFGHTLKVFLHPDSNRAQSNYVLPNYEKFNNFNNFSEEYFGKDRVSRVEVFADDPSLRFSDWNCCNVRLRFNDGVVALEYDTSGKDVVTSTLFPPQELFEKEHKEARERQ